MKRLTLILAAALLACQTTQAQSLSDLLKFFGFGGQTETKEQTAEQTAPALTTAKLLGQWRYAEPASRYDGDDMLGSFGMKAVETMLPAMYAKAGLDSSATVTFSSADTASGHIGDYTLTGKYRFNETDGTMTVTATVGGVDGVLHGTATLDDGMLTLLFDAQEAASIVERISDKAASNEKFRMMKSVLDSYPGVKMGCRMKR